MAIKVGLNYGMQGSGGAINLQGNTRTIQGSSPKLQRTGNPQQAARISQPGLNYAQLNKSARAPVSSNADPGGDARRAIAEANAATAGLLAKYMALQQQAYAPELPSNLAAKARKQA